MAVCRRRRKKKNTRESSDAGQHADWASKTLCESERNVVALSLKGDLRATLQSTMLVCQPRETTSRSLHPGPKTNAAASTASS